MIISISQIKELVSSQKFLELKEILVKAHPVDIAYKFVDLKDEEKLVVFRFLDKHKSVEVFKNLSFKIKHFFLKNLKNNEISEILNNLQDIEIANIFRKLNNQQQAVLFNFIQNEKAVDVKKLLIYNERTAGSWMTTEIKQDMENIESGIKVHENDSEDVVLDLFLSYKVLNIFVVDENDRLVGVILFENILDLMQEKNIKEIYALGKVYIETKEDVSYANSTIFDLLKRRAGWCMLLLIFDFFAVSILKHYEIEIVRFVAFSFFLPMIFNSVGNAGLQVSVSIANELKRVQNLGRNFWIFGIIKKEFVAGLLLALFIGAMSFVRGYLLNYDFVMALFVGITLFFIVFMSTMTGLFLPLISKRIGLDPAALTAPLIASIVNIIGLLIYFNIATVFLPALKGVF